MKCTFTNPVYLNRQQATGNRQQATGNRQHCLILTLFILSLFSCFTGMAQTQDDVNAGKVNGVWWINNDALADVSAFARLSPDELSTLGTTTANIKSSYPATVGVLASITWKSLAPTYSKPNSRPDYRWGLLDTLLQSYADSNLLIMLMVWTGPDCPGWLFNPPFNVPSVMTDADTSTIYPYYLFTKANGKQPYKDEWFKMMDSVATHVKAYTNKLRKSIVMVQSAEGSTGDEGPYKGNPLNTAYNIPRVPEWRDFKRAAWKKQDTLYRQQTSGNKKIHLLVNCDPDDPEDLGWLYTNVPYVWRKANTVGHGYQFNDERLKKGKFDTLVNKQSPYISDSLTRIRCRDEMDQYSGNPFQMISPRQFNFYQAASALYFGLDIWTHTATGLLDTANFKKGLDFFTRYAGYKTPQTAPGGFCVFHTGLDAADFSKYDTTLYGNGTQDLGDANGENRCVNIAALGPTNNSGTGTLGRYALGYAKQGDKQWAQGFATRQYRASKYNDAGWNIDTGNYERYLTQIIDPAPNSTKNGFAYWRLGDSTTEWYGRFATGFRGSLADSIFLKVDDSLFRNTGAVTCTLRIVYYDTGTTVTPNQSFRVYYDSYTDAAKLITPVFKTTGTSTWKEREIILTDGYFKHRGARGADIIIVNGDSKNEMFALVEILKSQ